MTVLLLAPALLVLAGAGSWWVPRWVDRALPHIDIEGAGARSAPEKVEAPPAPAEP
jgi:RND superfamily putative drug exporter